MSAEIVNANTDIQIEIEPAVILFQLATMSKGNITPLIIGKALALSLIDLLVICPKLQSKKTKWKENNYKFIFNL